MIANQILRIVISRKAVDDDHFVRFRRGSRFRSAIGFAHNHCPQIWHYILPSIGPSNHTSRAITRSVRPLRPAVILRHGRTFASPRLGDRQLGPSRWYAQFCEDAFRRPDQYGEDDRNEAIVDAIRLAIDDQERPAEIVTDGEMQRIDFYPSFYDLLTGLERLPQPRKLGAPGYDQIVKYQCIGPIAAPKGLGLVDAFKRLSGMTTSAVKVSAPGRSRLPASRRRQGVPRSRRHGRGAVADRQPGNAGAPDAGATIIQLDEPGFACRPNDPEPFLRLLQRVTAGVKAFVSMHLCFGNYRGRAVRTRSL